MTNILTVLHMILCWPFVQQKENVTITILEIGFTLASFLVPFFAESVHEESIADVIIYSLMTASIVTMLVSIYFFIVALYKKFKGKMKKKQEEDKQK